MTKLIILMAAMLATITLTPLCCAMQNTVEVEAARLQYLEKESVIRAEGSVSLHFQGLHVYTSALIIHLDTNWLETEGSVTLTAQGYEVTGTMLRYNLSTDQGTIDDVRSQQEGVYVSGRQAQYSPEKTALVDARFTTCDLDDPHYSLRAEYVELYPGDRIVMRNVTLYLLSMPAFWLPSYTYSFHETQQMMIPEIGYDEFSGWFIKVNYQIPSPENASTTLRFDYREKRGLAGGFWLKNTDDKGSTEIRLYQMRECGTGRSRGMSRVRYVGNPFASNAFLRLNIDQVSDKDFFLDYLADLGQAEAALLPSTIALDIYGETSRMLIQAQARINPTDTYAEFAPRLRLTSFVPTNLLRSLYLRTNLEFTNFYTEEGTLSQLLSSIECTDSWLLGGPLTFKPTFGYQLIAYQNEEDTASIGLARRQAYELFLQARGEAGLLSHNLSAQLGYYLVTVPQMNPPDIVGSQIDLEAKNLIRLSFDSNFSWAGSSVLETETQLEYKCTGEEHNLGPLRTSLQMPLHPGKIYLNLLHNFYADDPWYIRWGVDTENEAWSFAVDYSNYSSGEQFVSANSSILLTEGLRVSGKITYDIGKNELEHLSYGLDAILHCLGLRLSIQERPHWSVSAGIFLPAFETI